MRKFSTLMTHLSSKAGFVAIIGEPNVGKSTLMNAMLGTKLSIVTPKPQTTRKSILGIYTDDLASSNDVGQVPEQTPVQMVFFDTPGVLNPSYGLHRSMMEFVRSSVEGADVLLVVLDALKLTGQEKKGKRTTNKNISKTPNIPNGDEHPLATLTKRLKTTFEAIGKPVIVAINKMDALGDKKQVLPAMDALLKTGVVREVFAISALENKYVSDLLAALKSLMPEHEFFYDAELLSEQPQRFFVSEIIREAVFLGYEDEVPYSTEVNITEFKEREAGKWFISAEIIVERDTQKGIIIGKQGAKLKETGAKARAAIEAYLELPVFLELFVKVREGWRDNQTYLRSFGYGQPSSLK
jgi:GTP-binding protein Era